MSLLDKALDILESDTAQTVLDAGEVAIVTTRITGNSADGAKAAGYGTWVNSVTGQYPKIKQLTPGRATLVLTPEQTKLMQKNLDDMVARSLVPGTPGTIDYGFGAVFKPVAIKYAVPVIAASFALGFIAHWVWYR